MTETIFKGKISTFGGVADLGMTHTEGLSIYEHHEADNRLDLFFPRSQDPTQGASKRLRADMALYFACRFPIGILPRKVLQQTQWVFRNPVTKVTASLWLVDWGPNERVGRMFDISPAAAKVLGLKTDDEVEVLPWSIVQRSSIASVS